MFLKVKIKSTIPSCNCLRLISESTVLIINIILGYFRLNSPIVLSKYFFTEEIPQLIFIVSLYYVFLVVKFDVIEFKDSMGFLISLYNFSPSGVNSIPFGVFCVNFFPRLFSKFRILLVIAGWDT